MIILTAQFICTPRHNNILTLVLAWIQTHIYFILVRVRTHKVNAHVKHTCEYVLVYACVPIDRDNAQ